jgi:hypothetical protein
MKLAEFHSWGARATEQTMSEGSVNPSHPTVTLKSERSRR